MKTLYFLCVIYVLLVGKQCSGAGECDKKTSHLPPIRLKNDLLCDYDKTIRPVVNHSSSTTVTVKMVLKFFTYDMHSSTISIHNWLALYWKDDHLKWDPSKYESLKEIHLSSDEIWTPDLSIYNRNDQSGSPTALTTVDCLVTSTGTVVCVPPGRHEALCAPNLRKYPYDKQNCSLRYGSWVHSGEEINFKVPSTPVTMDDYMPNGHWKLISVKVKKFEGHFNCCPDNSYPSLNYNFLIERHSASHAATIIIPAIILIILTLTTLCMDPEYIGRLCVACCNILAHTFILETMTWQLPSTGDTPPMLLLYTRDSFLLCSFSIVLTVIVRSMMCSSKVTPAWISSVVSIVLSNNVGQIVLLYDSTVKGLAKAKGDDDTTNIINDSNPSSTASNDWALFAKLLDRLSFIAFLITYFCMFVTFIM